MRKDYWKEVAKGIKVSPYYDLKDFLTPEAEPVVSIYLPVNRTQRNGRLEEWDRIELKDLAKKAKQTLENKYGEKEFKPIEEKLDYLIEHKDLPVWLDAGKGLAILANKDNAYVMPLDFEPEACAVAGGYYYLKPLIRNLSYQMEYILLLLNSDSFALLLGDYNGLSYVPLPAECKQYLTETYPTYDGDKAPLDYYSLEGHMSPFHNFKSKNDVVKEETEKFFRYVNKIMNDVLVYRVDLPVILVALPEHVSEFKDVCTFKTLLPEAIKKDPAALTGDQLREAAINIVQNNRNEEIAERISEYNEKAAKGKASDDLNAIGMALAEGKVEVLFLAKGKALPGNYNPNNGEVFVDLEANPTDSLQTNPESPDLADAFARQAIAEDSMLIVLDQEAMPTKNFVAATYRY